VNILARHDRKAEPIFIERERFFPMDVQVCAGSVLNEAPLHLLVDSHTNTHYRGKRKS
jgi:hypothetical protein